ncbi:MAG TPA: HAD hydrolase family protein, partial [Clostridia bacterium]|nr:HAD hydrolase family protein [Clostridia bacterium]
AQDAVKKAVDYITLSNDQDGVAHVIEKYIMQPSLA